MGEHTPGPWEVDGDGPMIAVVESSVAGWGSTLITAVAFRCADVEEGEANARLIADAPLLLRQRDALLDEAKAALTTPKLDLVIRPCALSAMVNLRAAIAACEKID